jgi:hypothetical protein
MICGAAMSATIGYSIYPKPEEYACPQVGIDDDETFLQTLLQVELNTQRCSINSLH